MELRVLHYFLTVAREQSITRAAQSLHLSQPTLSRQLMDLDGNRRTADPAANP
ncbi:MAG: LysR family transcriptional regulator [Holdemania filiformis]